ncbi:HD domain-containing protein [Glycomyces sp. NPDC047010]|uniref:HD domain-containing protein n=1 Tax=Glycomyces sp. NPDC047010 TaxID=3155023 RepID=UPI003402C59F
MKRARRSGWWIAGIKDPESIAEHSWRAALTGKVLASLEGADPARTAKLCILHDTPATTTWTRLILRRSWPARPRSALTASRAPSAAIAEFEAGEMPEARGLGATWVEHGDRAAINAAAPVAVWCGSASM